MAHHTRELSDENWLIAPLDATVIRNLDEKTKKNVSGVGGGLYEPTAPIAIGGAGMRLLGPYNQLTGASSSIETGPNKHIVHARLDGDDYIALDPDHPDTLRALTTNVGPVGCDFAFVVQDNLFGSPGVTTRRTGVAFWSAPIRVHNKGRLLSFDLSWAVTQSHASVPASRPQFRVVRVDRKGKVEPLRIASDTDPNGFILLGDPTSGAAYSASTNPQFANYAVNQTALAKVDTSQYVYHAEFVEESGTNSFTSTNGNRFVFITANHDSVPHIGPQ